MDSIKARPNYTSSPDGIPDEQVKIIVKKTTGDPTGREKLMCINTFDNTFSIYADGAWQLITSW